MHDATLESTFARQRGLVTRRQARRAGLTDRQIDGRLANGTFVAMHPGVYRHAALPEDGDMRIRAALLALGPGAAASHRTAVGLIGLGSLSTGLVEVTWPRPSPRSLEGVVVHRLPDLSRPWVRSIDGIRVTRPARTLLDLGTVVHPWLVQRCMEEWLARRTVSIDQLQAAIAAHAGHGRRGVPVVRRLLEGRVLRDIVADSRFEGRLAEVLLAGGLPRPVHHHLVHAGRVVAELDWAYVDEQVALEFDGYGVHLRSLEAFEHDRDRQNELEILGWHVLRFSGRTVQARPRRIVDQVARMLAAGRNRDALATKTVAPAS
jgi:Protein of unknown function (DUF559)